MQKIRSLDDLNALKADLLEKRRQEASRGVAYVLVGMGSCGIAAGAEKTMDAMLSHIVTTHMRGIIVAKTGCIGFCDQEPIVQVQIGSEPNIIYGNITPEIARRILDEHVKEGHILRDHVINIKEPVL